MRIPRNREVVSADPRARRVRAEITHASSYFVGNRAGGVRSTVPYRAESAAS